MFKFLLLISFIFAPFGFSSDLQNNPKTPSEALKIANEPLEKWRASGDKSPQARRKAFSERESRAKSFAQLFKIEELAGEELYAFGQLSAFASEHDKAEKAFAKYLTGSRAANAALARQGLLRALTNQKKYPAAFPVAEAIVAESSDPALLAQIEAQMQPLKIEAPSQAKKLARLMLSKMLENGGAKISEADTIFASLVLVNSLQTAISSEDLKASAETREFIAEFMEKFKASALAQNKTLKREVEGVAARFNLIGNPAPAIQKTDSIGEAKTLTDHEGKIVVLDFLAHWCIACLESFPVYNRLREKYQSNGVEIVGVTRFYGYFGSQTELAPAAEKTEVARLRDSHAVKYGFLFTDEATESAYGIVGLPAIAIVDRKGVVRYARQGDTSAAELERLIEKLLAE